MQTFVCMLINTGIFYHPGKSRREKNVSSNSMFGGPWRLDEHRDLVNKKPKGDICRGDGYDAEESEYEEDS